MKPSHSVRDRLAVARGSGLVWAGACVTADLELACLT